MRVAFEVNSVLTHRYSGFFTYGAGLLEGFETLDDRPEMTFFCGRKVYDHADWLAEIPLCRQSNWKVCKIKLRYLQRWWRWCSLPSLETFTGPFDLYHCNHQIMGPTRGKPRLLTIHDLRRYRYPEYYPHSNLAPFEHAVKKADHFIAISKATKQDLQTYFEIDDERIDVVYHGGSLRCVGATLKDDQNSNDLLQRFNLHPNRYFFTFSSYDKRKNLTASVRAFLQIADRLEEDYRLVIVGELPKQDDIFPEDTNAHLAKRVIFTGPLDNFMPLMRQATSLVYPSIYEGFGLPILEAMAVGTAVITSNCSSMPEVAGEAALLVDPHSLDDIADAMVRIAQNEPLREKLIAAGKKRSDEFSWQRSARETLAIYKKLT